LLSWLWLVVQEVMHEREPGTPYPLEDTALNGYPAVCAIRIYRNDGKTAVVATDLDVGPSVTGNVEQIAMRLRQQWKRGTKAELEALIGRTF
jgi:hypothetical protein